MYLKFYNLFKNQLVRKFVFIWLIFYQVVFFSNIAYCNEKENAVPAHTYTSSSWNAAINQSTPKKDDYPDKRKINAETIRRTLNEYYIPQVSELLSKGVDYYEWLDTLDDPYLNRYKLDLKVDPDADRLRLFWKQNF